MSSQDTPPTNPRKEATERLLRGLGVPINSWLPLVEDEAEARLQQAEDVAARAMVLYSVSAAAQDQHRAIAIDVLRTSGLWDWLSAKERAFLKDDRPSDRDRIDASWRVEGAWTLLWALGKIPDLSLPTSLCDFPKLERVAPPREHIRRFCVDAALRPISDILDETDKIYRIHWAVRNASLEGSEPPGNFNPSVVLERHRALNWVTCYQDDWDEVTTDT